MIDDKAIWIKSYGNSMEPTIFNGDMVYIIPVQKLNEIDKGDILFILKANRDTVIHRVLSETRRVIFTMGDNATASDNETFTIDNILGKCLYTFNNNGLKEISSFNRRTIRKYITTLLISGERLYLLTYRLPEVVRRLIYRLFRKTIWYVIYLLGSRPSVRYVKESSRK